jgi:hypothetical protein
VQSASGNKYLVTPIALFAVAPAWTGEEGKKKKKKNAPVPGHNKECSQWHKQACPYLVHFGMEIDFGPTLWHKVLLTSVHERKLCTCFSGLALYLIPGYQSCWQIVVSRGNCKAFIQLPYSSLGYCAG